MAVGQDDSNKNRSKNGETGLPSDRSILIVSPAFQSWQSQNTLNSAGFYRVGDLDLEPMSWLTLAAGLHRGSPECLDLISF